jgi:hypothetical protein
MRLRLLLLGTHLALFAAWLGKSGFGFKLNSWSDGHYDPRRSDPSAACGAVGVRRQSERPPVFRSLRL